MGESNSKNKIETKPSSDIPISSLHTPTDNHSLSPLGFAQQFSVPEKSKKSALPSEADAQDQEHMKQQLWRKLQMIADDKAVVRIRQNGGEDVSISRFECVDGYIPGDIILKGMAAREFKENGHQKPDKVAYAMQLKTKYSKDVLIWSSHIEKSKMLNNIRDFITTSFTEQVGSLCNAVNDSPGFEGISSLIKQFPQTYAEFNSLFKTKVQDLLATKNLASVDHNHVVSEKKPSSPVMHNTNKEHQANVSYSQSKVFGHGNKGNFSRKPAYIQPAYIQPDNRSFPLVPVSA